MKFKQNNLLCLKRKDIIICPYFRLKYWEYKKNKIVLDMYCSLDDMIFLSYKVKGKLTKQEIDNIRMQMRSNCSMECPRIWNQTPDDCDVYGCGYEDFLYDQMFSDEGAYISKFDDDFKFDNPPF